MAQVFEFPTSRPAERLKSSRRTPAPIDPKLPATAGRGGQYALADVARPLGLHHKSIRTIIDTLRALARHSGMPLPRTPRVVSGKPLAGPQVICKDSRWDAGEIDAWLDGRGPAGPAAAAAPSLPMPIRAEMAQRALRIGAGQ